MQLLIDIGNTRLKWAVCIEGKIFSQHALLHQQQSLVEKLYLHWKSLFTPTAIAISCVSITPLAEQVINLAKRLWPDCVIVQAQAQAYGFGVTNAYPQPEKLGVDRWLCLLAARKQGTLPICIADMGTATTVDVLDKSGIHQGGVIAPGITLMKQALAQATNDLSYARQSYSVGLSNMTEPAIYSGAILSTVGLIEQMMLRQAEHTQLLLTGGDAELITEHLTRSFYLEPDLVLKGLSILLDKQ